MSSVSQENKLISQMEKWSCTHVYLISFSQYPFFCIYLQNSYSCVLFTSYQSKSLTCSYYYPLRLSSCRRSPPHAGPHKFFSFMFAFISLLVIASSTLLPLLVTVSHLFVSFLLCLNSHLAASSIKPTPIFLLSRSSPHRRSHQPASF